MDLLGDQLTIVLSATVASIGAAGVPGAGMIICHGSNSRWDSCDRSRAYSGNGPLVDMFRTAVNVTGDLAVTATMAVAEGESVKVLTHEEDEADPESGFENRLEKDEEPVEPA